MSQMQLLPNLRTQRMSRRDRVIGKAKRLHVLPNIPLDAQRVALASSALTRNHRECFATVSYTAITLRGQSELAGSPMAFDLASDDDFVEEHASGVRRMHSPERGRFMELCTKRPVPVCTGSTRPCCKSSRRGDTWLKRVSITQRY